MDTTSQPTNGAAAKAETPIAANPNTVPWSPLFGLNRHVALEFPSSEELDRAIDWLWTSWELQHMPRRHVGRNTMIVPDTAVELFRQQSLQFEVLPVTSMGDIPPEEANRIRRER